VAYCSIRRLGGAQGKADDPSTDAVLSLQIFPIEESAFTLAYGPLTERLRERSCGFCKKFLKSCLCGATKEQQKISTFLSSL
jgi:hypothetical protein